MRYYVLDNKLDETDAYITDLPENLSDKYELLQGVPRLATWPNDVKFTYSRHYPEGINLTDYVGNKFRWMIVSDRFRSVLADTDLENVEYLPISIRNHKGRMADDNYWIVNFLALTEVIDRDRSDYREDAAFEGQISRFDNMVLRDEVQTDGPPVLRMREDPMMVLVREDFKTAMEKEGLTGMQYWETDTYKTFDPVRLRAR